MAGRIYKSAYVITGDSSGAIRATRMTSKELGNLNRSMDQAGRSARNFSRHSRGMYGSLTSIHGITRQLAPLLGGLSVAMGARSIVNAGLAMDGYGRSLRAVLGSAEAATQELKFIRSEAERVGVEFQPLVREYSKLAAAARDTSMEGEGVRKTFSAIIEISRVLNLSTEDTRGAIFALQQMLSKGTISAEELRRQLGERVPGSLNAMARAVGVSVQELDKMLKQGQLISEEVMPKFAEELKRMAESGLEFAVNSPAAEFDRLRNALFDFNVEAGKNVMPVLADGARVLTKGLNFLHENLYEVLTVLGGYTILRTMLIPSIKYLLGPIRAWTIAEGLLYHKLEAKRVSLLATSKVIKLMGGPLMAGATLAAGAFAGAVYKLNEVASETTGITDRVNQQLERLKLHATDPLSPEGMYILRDVLRQINAEADKAADRAAEVASAQQMASFVPGAGGASGLGSAVMVMQNVAAQEELTYAREQAENQTWALEAAESALAAVHGDAAFNVGLLGFEIETLVKYLGPWARASWDALGGWQMFVDHSSLARKEFVEVKTVLERKVKTIKNATKNVLEHAKALLENAHLSDKNKEALRELIKFIEDDAAETKRAADEKKAGAAAQRKFNKALADGQKAYRAILKEMNPHLALMDEYAIKATNLNLTEEFLNATYEEQQEMLLALRRSMGYYRDEKEELDHINDKFIEKTEKETAELAHENEVLRYAIEHSEDLTIAKLILANAGDDVVNAARREIEAHEALLKQYKAQQEEVGVLDEIVRRSVERMDDAFQGFWENVLRGGKGALDSLKSLAIQTASEIIHALTTRRLTAAITSAFLPAGTAMAGGGVASGGGFGSLFSGGGGLAQMFTGNSIGTGFAGLPPWLGGNTVGNLGPNYGIAQSGTGLFGNAGAYSNMSYGIAGLAGYFGGDLLFGGKGGMGGSIGATIGLAAGGPIGAIAGGLIGGFLGGLIKDRPALIETGTQSRAHESSSDYDRFIDSAFGGINVRSRRLDEADADAFGQALADFDNHLAQFLDSGQTELITSALADWRIRMEGEAISLEDTLDNRWGVILSTFESDVQGFVKGVDGMEDQVARLGQVLDAQSIVDAAPELFEGHTWQEFIAVAQKAQAEGEELNQTFARIVTQMQLIAAATETLKNFSASDLATDYLALVEANNQTAYGAWQTSSVILDETLSKFDGSIAAVMELAQLSGQHYENELNALMALDDALSSINATYGQSIERMEAEFRTGDENYEYYRKLAENSAASLMGMSDPELIRQTMEDINRWTNQAYGYLTDEQRASMGPEVIDFLKHVRDLGGDRIEKAREEILSDAEAFREEIGAAAQDIKDPLLLVADELGLSAEDLKLAAEDLSTSADALIAAGAPGTGVDGGASVKIKNPNKKHGVGSFDYTANKGIEVSVDTDRLEKVVYAGSVNNHNATAALIQAVNTFLTTTRSQQGQVGGSVK